MSVVLGLVIASLLGACSLSLDLKTKQCSSKSDCDGLTETNETYTCNGGICQHESCEGQDNGDAFCRSQHEELGKSFATSICEADPGQGGKMACLPAQCAGNDGCQEGEVCNTSLNRCVKESEATCPAQTDDQCAAFGDIPFCINGVCSEAECKSDDECKKSSPTSECRQGRCSDDVWGCLDEPEEEVPATNVATYELTVLEELSRAMPGDLTVKLCGPANDFACATPPPGATVELDHDKSILRIKGLAEGTPVHMQLFGSGLFDNRFFSQQVVRAPKTVASAEIIMIPKSLIPALEAATDSNADMINLGTGLGRIFDCQGKLAAGTSIQSSHLHRAGTITDTTYFYITFGDQPLAAATATDDFGCWGILNLDPGKQTTLSMSLGSRKIASHVAVPEAGWLTTVHFYPNSMR